mmetsp:Transcript_31961/g.51623  ORF Transcript_31961/g.51623 Transcript_31961/m.51623 type:complete len:361 (+) Transcript_31961:57-1139(+)|eukprot:CAMPEP_0184347232 /NCGR_PEP_ID=MMETSP1089-20130417/15365_1 /TAXON_ID=38269 ORGANISM="Gloeochaete wittrockiana, Strain SAG46.84" /NCGR_SAMPLE_ID=MMETSP1089 /ASSEMBLY_ACC=CAM_ASM_000445 /LENGTH=360 /DNA_ID=CAMNT_0026678195 /DNA_START=60 /DNA_END=1142 /DNA_ORIENTATION=-
MVRRSLSFQPTAVVRRQPLKQAKKEFESDVPAWQGLVFSALAPMISAIFTNPWDVAKVRLQLQGELVRSGKGANVYSGTWDCLKKIYAYEGVPGLMKGLPAAFFREGSKNVFRLGCYEPVLNVLHRDPSTKPPIWKKMIAGAISGSTGAVVSNPFEITKTRLQSQAADVIATGYQHRYKNMWDALSGVAKREGIQGLFRGSKTSVIRSSMGTSTTIPAYTTLRDLLRPRLGDNAATDALASIVSAIITGFVINPVDVIRTRIYNQGLNPDGTGKLYKNALDACVKIVASEGPSALMKGLGPSLLRIGPHVVLTFVLLEQFKRMAKKRIKRTTTGTKVVRIRARLRQGQRLRQNIAVQKQF